MAKEKKRLGMWDALMMRDMTHPEDYGSGMPDNSEDESNFREQVSRFAPVAEVLAGLVERLDQRVDNPVATLREIIERAKLPYDSGHGDAAWWDLGQARLLWVEVLQRDFDAVFERFRNRSTHGSDTFNEAEAGRWVEYIALMAGTDAATIGQMAEWGPASQQTRAAIDQLLAESDARPPGGLKALTTDDLVRALQLNGDQALALSQLLTLAGPFKIVPAED